MCGIVGYAGVKNAESVLLVGLLNLEYRGYDSAGIAVVDKEEIEIRKDKGKIKVLESILKEKPVSGTVGIAHTRWATHGEPSSLNAHPHSDMDKNVVVVHNGVIENYQAIKDHLQSIGISFRTDTDSEVIPNLLNQFKRQGFSNSEAIQKIIKELEGKWSVAVIFADDPTKVYFAMNGLSLLIGKGKEEFYLASDQSALIRNCDEIYTLRNKEWGYLSREDMELLDGHGSKINFVFQKYKLKWGDEDRNGYPHYMLKEIFEQPGVIRRNIQKRISSDHQILFEELDSHQNLFKHVNRIIVLAAGTSMKAGMLVKKYLEKFTKIPVESELPSEYRYKNPSVEGDTIIIAISQSGETADTLSAVREAKSKFLKVISFVNNPLSNLARESDISIHLDAGIEYGVSSTKAFSSEIFHLFLFALYLGAIKGTISESEKIQYLEELHLFPSKMDIVLQRANILKKWAFNFVSINDFVFLGRDYNHPIALEGASKIKEVAYIHSSGYSASEFKHAPMALITNEVVAICIINHNDTYQKSVSNLKDIKSRNGITVSIVTEGDLEAVSMSDYYFEIPRSLDILSSMLTIIPIQLLTYHLAIARGCTPDQPEFLRKI